MTGRYGVFGPPSWGLDSEIVRARSALFDVYGSYLRARGGAATIAALVRLLEPLGFFPAMVVMTIGALLCFDVRSPLVIAAATALIVGTSYLIFVRFLLVPFPPGFLGLT